MTYTEQFLDIIANDYKSYLGICNSIVGKSLGGDLLSDIYIHFTKQNVPESVLINKKAIPYFYISAKRFAYIHYFKKKRIIKSDYKNYLNDIELESELVNNNVEKYNVILSTLENLHNNKKIKWYHYKLFKLFYFSEYEYNITEYDNKEVNKLRKMSLRGLEEKLDINFMSINFSLKKTLKILKEEINKSNLN